MFFVKYVSTIQHESQIKLAPRESFAKSYELVCRKSKANVDVTFIISAIFPPYL
jgi:hypothetical protein